MKKATILCVGIGGYANTYLSALLEEQDPDFTIVGMIDVAPQNCTFYPKMVQMGIPLYDSMDAFYAEKTADLAIIATPIHFHTRQILCALEHGSNVICEKPLSGVSADATLLKHAMERSGKFVMIGYQWSYSQAILDLKQDISRGLYGKAQHLKTIVLWPRDKAYYNRGSGWGGKIRTQDGSVINDSVVSNATAHYLHNIFYVTGGFHGLSNEAENIECTLLRTNAIENFDTATVRFSLKNGGTGLLVVSHATESTVNPVFAYQFEKGLVTYCAQDNQIIGHLSDGSIKQYGDPFVHVNKKIYDAIAACRCADYIPACGVEAAVPSMPGI